MDKEIALQNLISVCGVLKELGIRHFLIDGTLLGLIRNNDFISFDLDTDIGVRFEDFTEEKLISLKTKLRDIGFLINHIFGDFENNFEISFIRNGVKTDLFFYRDREDKVIFHAFNGDDVITYQYDKILIDELTEANFKDNSFFIPKQAEKVLEAKYGSDWRIEDHHWDWAYSPKNIINQKPIVFTVGCFDTLHEGHINLFKEMAKLAGIKNFDSPLFWVLIHDDYSILENKGRLPVQTLKHRSMNLDILKITHSIEVNHADPTPEIKAFVEKNAGRKMIYVRADDWIDFPGREYLDEQKIPLYFVHYTENVSTTMIRKSLKNNNIL